MRDYRRRCLPAAPCPAGHWSGDQIRRLRAILDRDRDGIGSARHGEVLALSREWGRTSQSITQYLARLRADRRAGLRGPGARKGSRRPRWTASETARLDAILTRATDGRETARPGELVEVSEATGRTVHAIAVKLHYLRRGRASETAA